MPRLDAAGLVSLGTALLARAGAPAADARLVAEHLVEANLAGHDTHGILRLQQYLDLLRTGAVRAGAPFVVVADHGGLVQASGNWNFGPVTAVAAVQLAMARAADGALSVVAVRDCGYLARLGPFAARAAAARMLAIVAANGHGGDLAVAPPHGRGRRLSTNPLCVAVPTLRPWPILVDMATSAVSGGRLRLWRRQGGAAAHALVDARGAETVDVEAYYGDPPGALQPLGAPEFGHRGFGLGMLLDVLAGALSGAGCSGAPGAPGAPGGNALFVAVLRVEAFQAWEEYGARTERLIDWLHAQGGGPGGGRWLLPGEHAYAASRARARTGVPVDPVTWARLLALAAEYGVVAPAPLAS